MKLMTVYNEIIVWTLNWLSENQTMPNGTNQNQHINHKQTLPDVTQTSEDCAQAKALNTEHNRCK